MVFCLISVDSRIKETKIALVLKQDFAIVTVCAIKVSVLFTRMSGNGKVYITEGKKEISHRILFAEFEVLSFGMF